MDWCFQWWWYRWHPRSTNVEHPRKSGSITAQTVFTLPANFFSVCRHLSLALTDCSPVKLIYTHAAQAKPTPYLLCPAIVPNNTIAVKSCFNAQYRNKKISIDTQFVYYIFTMIARNAYAIIKFISPN